MKKRYLAVNKYLFHSNTPEGDGGTGAGAGGQGEPDVGSQSQSTVEGQSSTPDWRESIPSNLKDNPRFKDAESLEAIFNAYAEVKEAAVLPETITTPEGMAPEFGKWAVENGLNQKQFDAMLTQYGTIEQARLTGIVEANKTGSKALYETWGEAKKENLALANRVLEYADPKGELKLVEFLKSPASGYAADNPMIIQLFYNLGKAMKEGGALVSADPPSDSNTQKVPVAHELYPNQAPKK